MMPLTRRGSPTRIYTTRRDTIIVRAVYRIEGPWVGPTPDELTEQTKDRKKFTGRRDQEMEGRYLWTHVGDHLAAGSQNPIRFVNC